MFFRCRRRNSLFQLLLLLLGLKAVNRSRWTEEERKSFRTKAKKCRGKLREACAVWEDEDEPETETVTETVTETE
ncbi:hypothetical protein D2Q93_14910 [Alicyclobacillaceae bacterium I2511]|nr:hypothetical protein D2Q93_14910 [Alicyclobacillaceae bacterium I2511]